MSKKQTSMLESGVEVVVTAPSKYDPLGLDLVVARAGKQYAIAAHCVELVKPLPGAHLYLATLLQWRSKQGELPLFPRLRVKCLCSVTYLRRDYPPSRSAPTSCQVPHE